MAHRKWKEIKQQPGTAGPGNILGCWLVSLFFLCDIHSTHSVQSYIFNFYHPSHKDTNSIKSCSKQVVWRFAETTFKAFLLNEMGTLVVLLNDRFARACMAWWENFTKRLDLPERKCSKFGKRQTGNGATSAPQLGLPSPAAGDVYHFQKMHKKSCRTDKGGAVILGLRDTVKNGLNCHINRLSLKPSTTGMVKKVGPRLRELALPREAASRGHETFGPSFRGTLQTNINVWMFFIKRYS